MKDLKKSNGFIGIDMTIAIMAILIFSALIVSLMYNNLLENIKSKKEAMAMIYITETFENIAIANYEEVTENNKNNFIPKDIKEAYNIQINISSELDLSTNKSEDIIKKIVATITYKAGNKDYKISMQRTKIKE